MTKAGAPLLKSFTVFDVSDPAEMDSASQVSRRFPSNNNVNTYVLHDRALHRSPPKHEVLTRLAMRQAGDLLVAYVSDRYSTEVGIVGPGVDRFCLTMMLQGSMELCAAPTSGWAFANDMRGLAYRGEAGTHLLTGDNNARLNVWVTADRVERALQGLLDDRLAGPLVFAPSVDWSAGFGTSLHNFIRLLAADLERTDGIASNPLTLCSFTDLVVQTMLQGLPHNYTDRLRRPKSDPVPRYLRRAEDFMRASADQSISLQDVADAAGCSVRSLHDVFRRFRGTTPLAALHRVRLERIRDKLAARDSDVPMMEIARRFGFTNRGRFVAAYAKSFGEPPPGTRRRGLVVGPSPGHLDATEPPDRGLDAGEAAGEAAD